MVPVIPFTRFDRHLFNNQTPDLTDCSESIETIAERFEDIGDILGSSELDDRALPFFCDWLIDNVHLVEITAATDEDAYTIFETMNDRGLSLTPLDMLKGYLLANIKDVDKRSLAADGWKRRVESLRKLGKDEDSDAVKAWLRAKRSQNVRARQKGAENQDFEKIGTEFHRWVGGQSDALGLVDTQSFFEFVQKDMRFYTEQYERLRRAAQEPTRGLEPVYHVAAYNFTLQFPMLLAPLNPADSPAVLDAKVRTVASFLDILLARRAVNYLSMTFSALNYTMFGIIKEIRDASLADLVAILRRQLDDQGCDFTGTTDGTRSGVSRFGLNQWSKRYIKILLARMTHYIEAESGMDSSLEAYLAQGKFEIEHIWADHPERHTDEFSSTAEFADYRNRFGGLLLLPKQFNASYGDLPYVNENDPEKGKLRHYLTQNLLARSLHEQCYERHPGFQRFIGSSGLPFRSHAEFKKADLDARQMLYQQLAERVWSPDNLLREVEA